MSLLPNEEKLYEDLMQLPTLSEAFYFVDQIMGSVTFRIFLYRLASYGDWLYPSALESRGTTFAIDDDENPLGLVSRPLHKFFNLYENPSTMEVDFTNTTAILDKMDGSLISTVDTPTGVWLKSKGSLFSDQAQAANALIKTPEYESLHDFLIQSVLNDCTVCMEYTAPTNRIVIGYMKPALTVLAVRDNNSGIYFPLEFLENQAGDAVQFFVENIIDHVDGDVSEFVSEIPFMEKIEGFVIWTDTITVKVKTTWYLALHWLKDSINSPRRLFECVLEETTDDLRAQFFDDPLALKMITEMEEKVTSIHNHMVNMVETFHSRNKLLERKEYAIKGQKELDKMCFGHAMSLYLGREVDYKAFMKKHYKEFGVTDTIEENEA